MMTRTAQAHGRFRRPGSGLFTAAGISAAALVLAACGGSAEAEKPNAAGGGPKDKSLQYAECLRGAGLDVKDPEPGAPVSIRQGTDPAQVEAAFKQCKQYAPQQITDEKQKEYAKHSQDVANCLRENGVPGVQDPNENGVFTFPPPEVQDTPVFKAALESCRGVMNNSKEIGK